MLLRPALLALLLAGSLLLAGPALAEEGDEEGASAPETAEDGGGGGDDDDGGDGGGGGAGGGAPSAGQTPSTPSTAGTTLTAAQTQPSTIPLDAAAQEVEVSRTAEQAAETSTDAENATVAAATSPSLAPPVYRLKEMGETCMLMVMEAVMRFSYETKSKEIRSKDLYMDPSEPSGDCGDDEAELVIKQQYYTLRWSFSKTPGGDRWYVNQVQVHFDKSVSEIFENPSSTGVVTLSTRPVHGTTLFPTPVGKSFHCQEEYSLEFRDGSTDSATLTLQDIRVQPFMFKEDFGPAFECSPGGVPKFRSETAPIAVGSTLAVVVLLTVSGYGVYRYFKIKKVQYDTME